MTIKEMVDRFLGWKLPADFSPDGGVSFSRTYNGYKDSVYTEDIPRDPESHWWPIGTNLLTADQATAMFEYVLCAPSETGTQDVDVSLSRVSGGTNMPLPTNQPAAEGTPRTDAREYQAKQYAFTGDNKPKQSWADFARTLEREAAEHLQTARDYYGTIHYLEVENTHLRHDIARHVEIASKEATARVEAENDAAAVRELMNVYNLGGWTDALGPMKRALAAESAIRDTTTDPKILSRQLDTVAHNILQPAVRMLGITEARIVTRAARFLEQLAVTNAPPPEGGATHSGRHIRPIDEGDGFSTPAIQEPK